MYEAQANRVGAWQRALAGVILGCTGCSNGDVPVQVAGASLLGAASAPSAGAIRWVTAKPEPGVSLAMPSNWTASRSDALNGPIVFNGPRNAQAAIWPVFLPREQQMAPPEAVVTSLARRLAPDVRWDRPQRAGRNVMRMQGRGGRDVATAAFAFVEARPGVSGNVYLSRSLAEDYAGLVPTFAGIFSRTTIAGSGSAAGPGGREPSATRLAYRRWTEPNEQAMTADVPSSYRISGGVVRPALHVTTTNIQLLSPDGQVRIWHGDPAIPPFVLPTQMLAFSGFPPGARYGSMIVRQYEPPQTFLQGYALNAMRRACGDPQIRDARALPQYVEMLNRIAAQYSVPGIGSGMQAGDVSVECNGGRTLGYFFATTNATVADASITGGEPIGTWSIQNLFGVIAPRERAGEAAEVLQRYVTSTVINPVWFGGEIETARRSSQIYREAANRTSDLISQSYWARQASQDEISRKRSNAMLELVDVVDPTDSREYKVSSGSNYYWINPQGTIVGTDVHARPDIDFTEMVQLP